MCVLYVVEVTLILFLKKTNQTKIQNQNQPTNTQTNIKNPTNHLWTYADHESNYAS